MYNTRFIAIKSLLEIFNKGSKPKESIENLSESLDKRDRAFVMEIVYGVLRYRDMLDWILKQFLKKISGLGDFTLNNLRIALFQFYFMRVPDWAVVNESVELEKCNPKMMIGRPSVVNAVLRNVMRQKNTLTLPLSFDDPVTSISLNTSHPKWLINRWVKRFGSDEALLLAKANNEIPELTIRVNTLITTREQLIKELLKREINAELTSFSPDGILIRGTRSFIDLSFIKGQFVVQDESSQLISYLLDPLPGERVLDACAAPGGKTTHIAQLMQDRGEIIAAEKDIKRIKYLQENIKNLGLKSVTIINGNINKLNNFGTFDKILVDAPCSSIGVIRKNPDVKYKHRPKDLFEYKSKQLEILLSASKLLRKNGSLVYSVCSTEPEECEDIANEFLKSSPDFLIINTDIEFLKHFTTEGFFRTYPHKYEMDGFFGAKFCRIK